MRGRTLVLLRHGRTEWNHVKRVQGQLEVGLDDEGRAQAARVAPALATLEPSLLWSSDLTRARETAEPLARATGLPVTYDARLREYYFGEREGLTNLEFEAAFPEEYAAFRLGEYDVVPTAERTLAVRARMLDVLGELLARLEPGETGVAVSHGAAIRVAVGALLGWPDDQFHTLRGLANCGWASIVEHPEHGGLRLDAYNRTAPARIDPIPARHR